MQTIFEESVFFGVLISLFSYGVGVWLKKRFRFPIFNPLLISIVLTMLVLWAASVDYDAYYSGAQYLSYFLTPATVCLAIPLYEQIELLRQNWKAVLLGISTGVLTGLMSILAMAWLFDLDHREYVTLLPKSITTAIGMGISQELGGYVTITVAVIVITGVIGNILAQSVLRWFRVEEPVARGIAIGTAAHAMGTARAMEMGEIEGAMSSLSIAVAGLLTVAGATVFSYFL